MTCIDAASSTLRSLLAAVLSWSLLWGVAATDDQIVLLTHDEILPGVQLLAIENGDVHIRDVSGEIRTFSVDSCIGFLRPSVVLQQPFAGVVALNDGQQYPGEAVSVSGANRGEEALRWRNRWFGLLQFPLHDVLWVGLVRGVSRPTALESDVVVLANGDRLEGFVTDIGDQIVVELEDDSIIRVPLHRCISVGLVNPTVPPDDGVSRIWIKNGTIVDVRTLALGDDQIMSLSGIKHAQEQDRRFHLSHIAGVMFDPDSLVPLASIIPHDIEGPVVRYIVPEPSVSSEPAPLGLRTISLRGPLIARYTQPEFAVRFVAKARLLDPTSAWADCEIVIYDDDREVFRATLNREQPEIEVLAHLQGAELSVEVTEGAHGPIEDRVVLERAMIISGN